MANSKLTAFTSECVNLCYPGWGSCDLGWVA